MAEKLILAIVGTTASGKSSLGMKVAQEFNGEIIAADSRTVYRGMDIGTAKANALDQDMIKHHCLDIAEPSVRYSVKDYQQEARTAIDQINSRSKLPILVGGTGLYIDSVLYDFSFGQQDSAKKDNIAAKPLSELQKLASEIEPNLSNSMLHNKRHLVSLIARGQSFKTKYPPKDNVIIVGLYPPKSRLRNNISKRVELMFKQGLRKEVDELIEQYSWKDEALSGIGYREFEDYYSGRISMSKVKRDIVSNTLKYAKRQRTWFKRNPNIHNFEDSESAYLFIKDKLKQL